MKRFLICVAAGVVAALLLIALTILANAQKTIPTCQPGQCRDDAGGGDRAGQPLWCQNKTERGYEANCKCTRSCDSTARGNGCVTYCRTKECRCDHGCPITVSTEPKGVCTSVGTIVLYNGALYGCNGVWKVKQLRLVMGF